MLRLMLAFLCLCGPALAGPDRVSVLLGSKHIHPVEQFEEVNPGAFLTWQRGRLSGTVGGYRNSYGRFSLAATGAFALWRGEDSQLDIFAGLARYPVEGRDFLVHVGDIVPLGGLQFRWRELFVQAIPLDGGVADAVLTVGLSFAMP